MKPCGAGRIVMSADAVGGVWTYSMELAAGLAELGIHTSLAVFGPHPSSEQVAVACQVDGLELVSSGLPLEWLAHDMSEVRQAAGFVKRLARDVNACLVHLNSPALAQGGFDVPVVGACHSCLATWWRAAGEGEMPHDFHWRIDATAAGLAGCSALIAPTQAFAGSVAEAYESARANVVHNGRRAVPERRRRPMGRFVFTAGRLWDAGKNLATLDQAATKLAAPVVAAGPTVGPTGGPVSFDRIQTVGMLSGGAISDWLAHRPVFACVALYEPFGLAVLEAAQAGCPLVLSDIPTFRELWDGAACFVEARAPGALAATLAALVADEASARKLGSAARERSRRYTIEAMVAGTLAIYRDVAPAPFRQLTEAAA